MKPSLAPRALAALLVTLVAPLSACGGDVTVTTSQTGCTDFNYSDPADPVVEWESIGEHEVLVWRANVLLDQAGATFSPEYAIDHGVLSVFEHWTDAASDDTFCYQPEVTVGDIRGGLEVRWFTEDDANVPFQTVDVEP